MGTTVPLRAIAIVLLFGMSTGCILGEDDGRLGLEETPGGAPWNHDDNVVCSTAEECGDGEVCENGICQMARCQTAFESTAPMGKTRYFGTDAEVAIISDDFYIDALESTDGSYMSSWDLEVGGSKIIDVAGGDLLGTKPHTIAVAIEFSEAVQLRTPNGTSQINVGFWPVAIAAGDIDGDGIDELVAFAADGQIALCDVDEDKCTGASITGATGTDVAVADVDADGFAEPLFLFDYDGESELVVWNTDAELNGQEESYGWRFSFPVRAMAAGKLTGGDAAEVAMLEDGGWWGWTDDKVHVYSPAAEAFIGSKDVDGRTLDLAVGDRDSDERHEIAILRESQQLELLKVDAQGAFTTLSEWNIPVGQNGQRISFVDWNGDSATGTLVEGPELVAGDAVPIVAMMFPPYPNKAAVGALSASVTLGDSDSVSETLTDTLTLSVGMGLSFGAEAFGFKAKVGGFINKSVSVGRAVTRTLSVGARYWILAQPDLQGTSYAPVIMSCGCYHRYKYVTDDPSNLIGGSGQTVDIFVPVGGQTQLWSSKRYNAMAEAIGLPIIEVPITVGDVGSYPSTIQTLDGLPVAAEDMVFPVLPEFELSDVGFVNFWLVAGEAETNSVATSTTLGLTSSFGAGVVSIDTDVSIGVTQGYSISVGNNQIFAGGIPPVPDNPQTPEDEFEVNRYRFMPAVFRQYYTDRHGDEAAYYVMNFAVAR